MRLLLHETVVTAPLTAALSRDWLEPAAGLTVELTGDLTAAAVGPEDIALLPSSGLGHVQHSHQVVPDVAVIEEGIGAVSLRTPVRPDEIERTPVRLLGDSGVGELVARATLQPYFGIQATAWVREIEEPAAEAVVLDGALALQPIEGGFAEDLCRAWFILTAMPVVSHVLVAPAGMTRSDLQSALDTLRVAREVGHERRREWRTELIERLGLDRERVLALLAGLRFELTPPDRQALAALVQRGGRGTGIPPLTNLRFFEPEQPNT